MLRVLAVALGAFSVLTVWAEGTMFSTQAMEGADVSPFSAMVRAAKDKGGLHMAVAIPLGYMCWCAYHSLFRLGMFSFYALVPGHTDSFSLLINAALTCRFAAPLSLNFLMMVPSLREGDANKETTFGRKFVDGVPDSARNFAAVFPVILVFYCGALAFGVFDKIFSACTSSFGGSLRDKYKFESDEKDLERNVHTTDGKRIAERERSAMQNQTKPKIGSGSPYYFELASGDMGRESEMADLGGRAADVDVERAGLLSAGGVVVSRGATSDRRAGGSVTRRGWRARWNGRGSCERRSPRERSRPGVRPARRGSGSDVGSALGPAVPTRRPAGGPGWTACSPRSAATSDLNL